MNFYSPAISFKRENEDYSILDCSSQCEIDQEEITDTSSPECSRKKHHVSALGFSSSNKKKFSVKRKLLLQKPVLDIQPKRSKIFVRTEGHFQRIKRKKMSTRKNNIYDGNYVQNSVQNLEKKLNESSVHYGVSTGREWLQCNFNPTLAALAAGLIKSPSPEIFSERGNEDSLDEYDIKEEIICSQDALDISIRNDKCIESAKMNDVLDNKDHSDFESSQEDIIYSQDSAGNISGIENNIFSDMCDKTNISLSHSKFSIGKQEENIDTDVSESDDSSEKDQQATLTSFTNSLPTKTIVEKMGATRYSKENEQKYNDPICSLTSNNIISQIELHQTNSEFVVKAPKKGTLLQRAYRIISNLKKEANLLSYEIQVGLRASKGALVSEPLIIHNIYFEEKNYIISCKPQNIEEINNLCHVQESIYLVTSNITMDMRINSVIVIHFPLVALLGLPVMNVILFAENRVQVISSNRVTGPIDISLPNLIIGPRDQKLICVVKKNNSKTVINAIVDQLFGKHSSLELKLLHIFKQRTATHTAVELLTMDSENQFCLVKDSEYNLLKDFNLEVNNLYIFIGFTLICSRVKNEVRSAAEYYSSSKFNNDFIYLVEPSIGSWKVNHVSKTEGITRNYLSLKSVKRNSPNHERFDFCVKEFKVNLNKIVIRDESFSEMTEIQFDEQCGGHKMKLISSSVPVVLCGVYFLNGMPAALFYLLLIAKVSALESNFLQETLNKIQQERLDNNEELNETDLASEFNGEIILGTVEESLDNNLMDQSFTNPVNMDSDEAATYVPNTQNVQTQNPDEQLDKEVKGYYYYYYYPLNHYLDQNKDTEPTTDSDEMHVMMDTMMKNTMMQKTENNVTPLFKAMTWFIGTAMVFILSILLMPKFKVKKSKVIMKNWENNDFMDIIYRYIPDNSRVNWKN